MIINFFIILFSINCFAFSPRTGVYKCEEDLNADICDQRLEQVFGEPNNPTALRLSYIGFCGDQGPYIYYCSNGTCTDSNIKITLINEDSYHWKNTKYAFECLMKYESN